MSRPYRHINLTPEDTVIYNLLMEDRNSGFGAFTQACANVFNQIVSTINHGHPLMIDEIPSGACAHHGREDDGDIVVWNGEDYEIVFASEIISPVFELRGNKKTSFHIDISRPFNGIKSYIDKKVSDLAYYQVNRESKIMLGGIDQACEKYQNNIMLGESFCEEVFNDAFHRVEQHSSSGKVRSVLMNDKTFYKFSQSISKDHFDKENRTFQYAMPGVYTLKGSLWAADVNTNKNVLDDVVYVFGAQDEVGVWSIIMDYGFIGQPSDYNRKLKLSSFGEFGCAIIYPEAVVKIMLF